MEGAFHTYASAPQLPKLKGLYIPLWFPPPCPLTGLFPRQDQPSPAQPFSPLIHSSNCCCPSRPEGTHGNFSPPWTLPPLLVLSWERNWSPFLLDWYRDTPFLAYTCDERDSPPPAAKGEAITPLQALVSHLLPLPPPTRVSAPTSPSSVLKALSAARAGTLGLVPCDLGQVT